MPDPDKELLDLFEDTIELMIRKRVKTIECSRFKIELDPGAYAAALPEKPAPPPPKPGQQPPHPDEDDEMWSAG